MATEVDQLRNCVPYQQGTTLIGETYRNATSLVMDLSQLLLLNFTMMKVGTEGCQWRDRLEQQGWLRTLLSGSWLWQIGIMRILRKDFFRYKLFTPRNTRVFSTFLAVYPKKPLLSFIKVGKFVSIGVLFFFFFFPLKVWTSILTLTVFRVGTFIT